MTYTENWTEVGTMCDGGDVGGDIQDSESYSRRFICQPVPGEFHVLEFNVYWALELASFGKSERWIQTQVYYGVCTDPDDVGGTETHSDYRYWNSGVIDMSCKHCGHGVVKDIQGTLVDDTGGDVCGWDGGNEPHDLRQSPDDGPREVCLQLGAEDLSEATSQMGA